MLFHRQTGSCRRFRPDAWRLVVKVANEWSKFVVKTFSTIDSISTTDIDCEQSLFSQSSLSSAGLERANWPRGKLERGLLPSFPSAFAPFALFPRSRFPRSRDHPKGLLAVYNGQRDKIVNFSPANRRRDLSKSKTKLTFYSTFRIATQFKPQAGNLGHSCAT